jgi:hypothetical protein
VDQQEVGLLEISPEFSQALSLLRSCLDSYSKNLTPVRKKKFHFLNKKKNYFQKKKRNYLTNCG